MEKEKKVQVTFSSVPFPSEVVELTELMVLRSGFPFEARLFLACSPLSDSSRAVLVCAMFRDVHPVPTHWSVLWFDCTRITMKTEMSVSPRFCDEH